MKTITLLGDFPADKRISMDGYFSQLNSRLNHHAPEYNIRGYIPRSRFAENNGAGNWSMRIARYLHYPQLVKSLKSDLYHVTDHGYAHLLKSLPADKCVITVHDIIPVLRYKGIVGGEKPRKPPFLASYSQSFLKRAARIIAISENSKNDIIEHCDCHPDKISVIYSGILNDDTECEYDKPAARDNLSLPGSSPNSDIKLVLLCGDSFYKNLDTSIEVLNRLQDKHNNVLTVHWGNPTSSDWQRAKQKARYPQKITEIQHLNNEQVKQIYRACDCVLFPSLYEGFGLPPLEAMALGTPAITSNVASLPEVTGNSDYSCNPYDVECLTHKVEKMLFDTDYARTAIQHGYRHSQGFNWKTTIDQTVSVYESVLNN